MQRGLQVYTEVCSSCHSLKYIAYRNLSDLGYNKAEIIIAKQRHGPIGSIKMHFDANFTKFSDLSVQEYDNILEWLKITQY